MSTPLVTRAVVIMGRIPKAGAVKTRLTPLWTAEEAAQLYEAFLRDVFALVDLAHQQMTFRRVFSCVLFESDDLAVAEALAPDGWEVMEQGEGELGDRIESSRARCDAEHVLVLGSDAPAMAPQRLIEAFRLLAKPELDLVIGPTEDGGYDLIGFQGLKQEVLRDIVWSTDSVSEQTRQRAEDAGYRLASLELGYDIDTPGDLDRALCDTETDGRACFYTKNTVARLRPT
jgi:hypothetical protein